MWGRWPPAPAFWSPTCGAGRLVTDNAPKLQLESADGDEAESVRARLRQHVSSPCEEGGGVQAPCTHQSRICAGCWPRQFVRCDCKRTGGLRCHWLSPPLLTDEKDWILQRFSFVALVFSGELVLTLLPHVLMSGHQLADKRRGRRWRGGVLFRTSTVVIRDVIRSHQSRHPWTLVCV